LPLLTGQQEKSARKEFFYINDDAQLVAMRYENWKMVFCEQKVQGTLEIWAAPFVCRRLPKMFNLRSDPTSGRYHLEHLLRLDDPAGVPDRPGQAMVAQFIETFKDFPPRQKPSSFSVDEVMAAMERSPG
jgi:arylsulfatase